MTRYKSHLSRALSAAVLNVEDDVIWVVLVSVCIEIVSGVEIHGVGVSGCDASSDSTC
jgi:hypothetical protein